MPESFSIGRDESNDIVISHPYVSEHHALLTIKNSDERIFHIQDLNTTNGTYKNDQPVTEVDFTVRDTIKIAGSILESQLYLSLCSQDGPSDSAEVQDINIQDKKSKRTTTSPYSVVSIGTLLVIAAALVVSVVGDCFILSATT